jgi:hypothetical protein
MIVEIENAILNDFRIRHEPFTDIETSEHVLLTPIKVQELGQAHERLVNAYLGHALGEPVETLWALTVGLLGRQDLDARWMHDQLAEINAGEQANAVIHLAHSLRETIKRDENRLTATSGYFENLFGPFCDVLEQEDRRVIRELKLTLREGVQIFEELEQDTIPRGGDRLLALLQTIPSILDSFYGRLYSFRRFSTITGI